MSPTNPSPSVVRQLPGKFSVLVDRPFNQMDESQRYLLGEFDSYDAATAACRRIVDEFFLASFDPAASADELYAAYMAFGEVPTVSPHDAGEQFSASAYARSRCAEIRGKVVFTMAKIPAAIGALAMIAGALLPAINWVNYPLEH
jgi:hypothetical protein